MGASARQDAERGRAAAAALLDGAGGPVTARLAGTGPEAWTAFDEEVRGLTAFSWRPPRGSRIEARLCDRDGRVREAALSEERDLPPQLVLIRCTDWAPPVRDRARRVLAGLVARDPVAALVDLSPLIVRLGRREHGAWAVEQLEAALSGRHSPVTAGWHPGRPFATWSWKALTGEQCAEALARLAERADLPTRRFAARLTVAAGESGVRDLARRASSELDPATARLWTDAALLALATGGPDDAAVDALLGGRLPMVRASGVTALRGAGRADEAARHLADRSGLVRACARWLLSQDGGDPYASYLALVTAPEQLSPYAVTGFSECAKRADAPLLRNLLDHPAGSVRAAAVAGLRRLESATDEAVLIPLLDDPWPAVAREAGLSLSPAAGRLDHRHLADRIGPDRPAHVRRAAFRLLRVRGGIHELRAAVALTDDPDPGLRTLARALVRGWNWQATLRSEEADRAELAELLGRSSHLFDAYELGLRRSRLGLTD
ncbi:hypothetical protein ACFYYB_24725 [Streptomyces sp. NPDC002886]|uniref:hypothetical protein n=1 Tax=Streptomyces sp. NPDC002886 TaxID=3364667 RepID=UPI00369C546F